MGIDVYARWEGMTEGEKQAQYTGFSTTDGHVGYLREAYHGGPYGAEVLFPECWDDAKVAAEGVRVPLDDAAIARFEEWAKISVSAGPTADAIVIPKMREWFGEYADPRYDPVADDYTVNSQAVPIPAATLRERLPACLEAVAERERGIYQGDDKAVRERQKAFIDFVELYERLTKEGKNPAVYVSY